MPVQATYTLQHVMSLLAKVSRETTASLNEVKKELRETHELLDAVNETTLRRMEDQMMAIQHLIEAVNETTLGRIESDIKEMREFLGHINRTTLGRIEDQIKEIRCALPAGPGISTDPH